MTVNVLDTLPVEKHVPQLLTFSDFNLILCFLIAIVIASFIFDLSIHQIIEFIRKLNRRQKNIQDIETNELLKALTLSEKGKRFLRGGRIGR